MMTEIRHINEDEFEEVISKNKVVLLDFFATWCPPCRMLTPELEKLKEMVGDKVEIVKINTDENENISRKFRIMSIPALMVFLDGEEVEKTVGYRDADRLLELVKKYID